MNKIIIALAIFLLTAGVCSADNYCGGMPLTTVQEGIVSGGVFSDSCYCDTTTPNQYSYEPNTIDKTFTLPSFENVEWAMLQTVVYCGHMQENRQGTVDVTFNGAVLGTETLNVPFTYIYWGGNDNSAFPLHSIGEPYKMVNDHVNRVTSDYLMWYDVTDNVTAGDNTASVHTAQIDSNFDGRIKLITLIVAYNDDSGKKIYYWINKGHDVDNSYLDYEGHNDYIGSTDFAASLPSGKYDASLTVVHMASTDGNYTFNSDSIPSGTPQGSYSGSNTWDVTSSFDTSGTNTLTYDRVGPFYKIPLGILTASVIPLTPVTIDIKPGCSPNSINLGSQGNVPVAIFSTATFDATTVNPSTVTLASASVKLKGQGTPMASSRDVNGDGLMDLVVYVSTEALELSSTDTEATLQGETYDGEKIEGTDSIRILP
jgi:hypothetical protein